MINWIPEKVYGNTPKGFGWAIYMKGYNTEYKDAKGDNLIFDTKKEALEFATILNIIEEAKNYNMVFTLADALDVLNTKPEWYRGEETVEEAVADYIEAYGG